MMLENEQLKQEIQQLTKDIIQVKMRLTIALQNARPKNGASRKRKLPAEFNEMSEDAINPNKIRSDQSEGLGVE